ncbi:MAG: T9SS type A sorting domain-containing protein [Rhodothermales bacterium]|nr:T9SS type A sorting domain-containing protein [Rhodothermales bacterium]
MKTAALATDTIETNTATSPVSDFTVYPLPTSGNVSIGFLINRPAFVKASVYDVLGRMVASVFDAMMPAGRQEFRLETGNWSSGVYVLDAVVDNYRVSRTLVVVK